MQPQRGRRRSLSLRLRPRPRARASRSCSLTCVGLKFQRPRPVVGGEDFFATVRPGEIWSNFFPDIPRQLFFLSPPHPAHLWREWRTAFSPDIEALLLLRNFLIGATRNQVYYYYNKVAFFHAEHFFNTRALRYSSN